MMRIPAVLAALALTTGAACADPWKDESGQGRGRPPQGGTVFVPLPGPYVPPYPDQRARVPRGHEPSPGECRVWIPGVPAGQQPPPQRCR